MLTMTANENSENEQAEAKNLPPVDVDRTLADAVGIPDEPVLDVKPFREGELDLIPYINGPLKDQLDEAIARAREELRGADKPVYIFIDDKPAYYGEGDNFPKILDFSDYVIQNEPVKKMDFSDYVVHVDTPKLDLDRLDDSVIYTNTHKKSDFRAVNYDAVESVEVNHLSYIDDRERNHYMWWDKSLSMGTPRVEFTPEQEAAIREIINRTSEDVSKHDSTPETETNTEEGK
jgi:hypothetical protein